MTNYDLEDRTFRLAQNIRRYIKVTPVAMVHESDVRQLLRSSGSIGANYLEANDGSSRKDTRHRILIARREAKETIYWLKLLADDNNSDRIAQLIDESTQIMKILSTIVRNLKWIFDFEFGFSNFCYSTLCLRKKAKPSWR